MQKGMFSMPMEQETIGMLVGGFSLIVGLMVLVTLFLWTRNKGNSLAYASVIFHFILLSVALYFFLKAINFNVDHPMASEEISLRMGVSGIVWAGSMICLLIGLIKFSQIKRAY